MPRSIFDLSVDDGSVTGCIGCLEGLNPLPPKFHKCEKRSCESNDTCDNCNNYYDPNTGKACSQADENPEKGSKCIRLDKFACESKQCKSNPKPDPDTFRSNNITWTKGTVGYKTCDDALRNIQTANCPVIAMNPNYIIEKDYAYCINNDIGDSKLGCKQVVRNNKPGLIWLDPSNKRKDGFKNGNTCTGPDDSWTERGTIMRCMTKVKGKDAADDCANTSNLHVKTLNSNVKSDRISAMCANN